MYSSKYKKNSNDFSFVNEVLSEVNNADFLIGAEDFYNVIDNGLSADTKKSYVWTAISAVGNEIGETLYQNVLNYIDNVSDIDTCKIKALQSMISMTGTTYSIFKNINTIPIEVLDTMDIFSMRYDYLIDQAKMANSSISALLENEILSSSDATDVLSTFNMISAYRHDNADTTTYMRESDYNELSVKKYIVKQKIDDAIFNVYCNLLSNFVCAKYNSLSGNHVYERLSNEILLSGFVIPNKYLSKILQYKAKWNIPVDFDVEKEVDLIDEGEKTLDDYTDPEQGVLSIEMQRRADGLSSLEPTTRYAYYTDSKTREYFLFIENWYNRQNAIYEGSKLYDIDNDYIEIAELTDYISLLRSDGSINENMISTVATTLCEMTTAARDIREYLKSLSQRTYMKGTFLLISYLINEYMKQNVYPTVSKILSNDVEFDTTDNTINLTLYIDQTLYFNILTDIAEDESDNTLNPLFWKYSGNNSLLNNIDSTNIFASETKSKLVCGKQFTLDLIDDFYTDLARSSQLSNVDNTKHISEFLNAVFAYGADNTYLDENGKVQCELPYDLSTQTRRFTIDIDNYIYQLSSAYVDSQFVLDQFTPVAKLNLQQQLNSAYSEYKSYLNLAYTSQLDVVKEDFQTSINSTKEQLDIIDNYKERYDNINTIYLNLINIYSAYTGEYVELDSASLSAKLKNYYLSALLGFNYIDASKQSKIINDTLSLIDQFNLLLTLFFKHIDSTTVLKEFNIRIASYDDKYAKLTYNNTCYNEKLSKLLSSSRTFENAYAGYSTLVIVYTTTLSLLQKEYDKVLSLMTYHVNTVEIKQFTSLSSLLSDYYGEVIELLNCVDSISAILDYTDTDWYKYKKDLYMRYTGNSVGKTPYYNITNQKHPSYLIHPCLMNFMSYADFSYPIESLAGLVEDSIRYTAKNNFADNFISDNGYLLSVWNNTLNGNTDYLTRYEKTNHKDEKNADNITYGYDGLFYPTAIAELLSISSTAYDKFYAKWYGNLNISTDEKFRIENQLQWLKTNFKDYITNDIIDISRYGLDAYGNSYILTKTDDATNGIIWMRYKNHPIAFPMLTYADDDFATGKLDYTYSLILYKENVTVSKFKDIKDIYTIGSKHKTPLFTDFIFSKDRTSILLNAKLDDSAYPSTIVANVSLEYVMSDTDNGFTGYFRTLTIDKQFGEYIKHPGLGYAFKTFYTKDKYVGSLYISENPKRMVVKIYNKNNANDTLAKEICYDFTTLPNGYKLDCSYDGNITIAYVSDNISDMNVNTYSSLSSNYNAIKSNISLAFNKQIVIDEYSVFQNTILKANTRKCQPLADMGFIPVLDANTKCSIVNTSFKLEFEDNGILKFQLIGAGLIEGGSRKYGIDFKFVYPIRMTEGYETYEVTDESYHYDTSSKKTYCYNDIRYLESLYNYYVKQNPDAIFWDLNADEKSLMIVDTAPDNKNYDNYEQLANYDVSRYLIALRSELPLDSIDNLITRPYLMKANTIPQRYIAGHVQLSDNDNIPATLKFVIELADGINISADYMTNDIGTIKLDFNSCYFKKDSIVKGKNTRNKLHIFLNLDKPGDAGYLTVYKNITTATISDGYTFFIKNISDTRPKFVIAKIKLTTAKDTGDDKADYIGIYENDLQYVLIAEDYSLTLLQI